MYGGQLFFPGGEYVSVLSKDLTEFQIPLEKILATPLHISLNMKPSWLL